MGPGLTGAAPKGQAPGPAWDAAGDRACGPRPRGRGARRSWGPGRGCGRWRWDAGLTPGAWHGLPLTETPNMKVPLLTGGEASSRGAGGEGDRAKGGHPRTAGLPLPPGSGPGPPRGGAEVWGDPRDDAASGPQGSDSSLSDGRSPAQGGLCLLVAVEPAALHVLEASAGASQLPTQDRPLTPLPAPGRTPRPKTPSKEPVVPAPGPMVPPPSAPWSPGWGGTVRASLPTMIYFRIKCITPRTCQFHSANVPRKSG